MSIIFFFKCYKIDIGIRNREKIWDKIVRFIDNCIWISCGKFSLLGTEYLSSEVNVLTKCPRMQDIAKRDIFEAIFAHSYEEIW